MAEPPMSLMSLSDGCWKVLSALWWPVNSAVAVRVRDGDGCEYAEVALSLDTIGDWTGKSATAVKRALKTLRDLDVVRRGLVDLGRGPVRGWHLYAGLGRSRTRRAGRGPKSSPEAVQPGSGPARKRSTTRTGNGPNNGPDPVPEPVKEPVVEPAAAAPGQPKKVTLAPLVDSLATYLLSVQADLHSPLVRSRFTLNVRGDLYDAIEACGGGADGALRVKLVVEGLGQLARRGNAAALDRWSSRALQSGGGWFETTEALVRRELANGASGSGEQLRGDDGSVIRVADGTDPLEED